MHSLTCFAVPPCLEPKKTKKEKKSKKSKKKALKGQKSDKKRGKAKSDRGSKKSPLKARKKAGKRRKQAGVEGLVREAAVEEVGGYRVPERLAGRGPCRVERRPQLAAQRATETCTIELTQDAFPDAATRWKEWPIEDCGSLIIRCVGEPAAMDVAADLAGAA